MELDKLQSLKSDRTRVAFFDIETTPKVKTFEELNEKEMYLFCTKMQRTYKNDLDLVDGDCSKIYPEKASVLSEYSKVICLSLGWEDADGDFNVKTLRDDEEEKIVTKFAKFVQKNFVNDTRFTHLCGHNVKGFDIPYMLRKMIKYDVPIPYYMNPTIRKPWENTHILDTKELMCFGDFNFRTSTLTEYLVMMGIDEYEMTKGEDVYKKYWEENDMDSIVAHCESDVEVTAKLFFKFLNVVAH